MAPKGNGGLLPYLFSKAWQYSLGNRRKVALVWALFVAANCMTLFGQPFVWATIVNTVQVKGVSRDSITTLLALLTLLLAFDMAFWAFHGPGRTIEQINAFKTRVNYRRYLLSGVLRLPLEWHAEHHSGDTIDKIEKGANALYQFSENTYEVVYGAVQLIGSYCVLAYFCPPAAGIVAAMILVSAWITTRFDRVLAGYYRDINHAENHISESVFDAVSNITTIIILRV